MLFAASCGADLKKTLAVLLDNIMLRLGKLESKVENIYNGTGANLTSGTSTAAPSATNAGKVNVAGEWRSPVNATTTATALSFWIQSIDLSSTVR